MKILHVGLADRSYDIHIAPGLLREAGTYCRAVLPRARRLALVSDSNTAPLYARDVLESLAGAGFQARLVQVPAGESSKSLKMLGDLYDAFSAQGLTRTDAVLALGGGVVGDLALLAQVDSSVGGKVAIDLPAGKNLAGAFWQPRLVLMDTDALSTLDGKTFSDGMAEVIKYGCIRDRAFFHLLEEHPSRAAVMEHIESVLYNCCDIKRDVVEKDERDTGERMVLNFGHTLGHAYEKAGHYETWTHGQAVAAGMVLAARLGVTLGVTPPGVPERIDALVTAFGLPDVIPCTHSDYASAIGLDKKGSGDDITLILLSGLGKAVLHKLPKAELLDMLAR